MDKLCSLCASTQLYTEATVASADIAQLYRRNFGIEISEVSSPLSAESLTLLRCERCDLRQFLPLWEGQPALYAALQSYPWYYKKNKHEFDVAREVIEPHDRVLEVGCGSGAFASSLPAAVDYTGLESNGKAVREALSCGLNVQDKSLDEVDGHFSVICVFQVLEHVAAPGEFLRVLTGRLAEGGRLVISVPAEDSFMRTEVNNIFNMPPHHITRWTDRALAALPGLLGLRLLSIQHEPLSSEHYVAFGQAKVWGWLGSLLGKSGGLTVLGRSKLVFSLVERAARLLLWPVAACFRQRLRGHTVTVVLEKPAQASP